MHNKKIKLVILISLVIFTLLIHYYELLFEGFLGHSHLLHVIHARVCYIPIVLGAIWFGIRGGFFTAISITAFALLYINLKHFSDPHELISEYTEMVFYLSIGGLSGILLEREESLRKKKEKAEKLLRQAERLSLIGEMAASVAHEIKNPLGSIKGAVQIIRDKLTADEEKSEFLEIIEKEANRLDNVVGDFLSYSRPSPANISVIKISDVIGSVARQLSFECRKRGVKIAIGCVDSLMIKGDADKLQQVFLNIMLNAVYALSEGGLIEINCERITQNSRDFIETIIKDNGPGIPPERLKRIFYPFFTTRSEGTGLGLSIAKAIVTEHEGTIEASSRVGEGTIFNIKLPAA